MKSVQEIKNILLGIILMITACQEYTRAQTPEEEIIAKRLEMISGEIQLPYNDSITMMIRNNIHSNESSGIIGSFLVYRNYFETNLQKHNFPLLLAVLPIAISEMDPLFVSRTNASGIWGLHAPAAVRSGLQLTPDIDPRYDIYASTQAAIAYLKFLHEEYNDWWTTIIAYVHGPSAIQNQDILNKNGQADPELILLNDTSVIRQTVLRFVYFSYLVYYFEEHNLTISYPETENLVKISVKNLILLNDLLKMTELDKMTFRKHNPVYISQNIVPSNEYPIYLPEINAEKFSIWEDSLYSLAITPVSKNSDPKESEKESIEYIVKKGDNIGIIASRHKVSISNIKSWNNLKNDIIYPGQKLIIYQKGPVSLQTTSHTNNTSPDSVSKGSNYITYTVKQGDSLWSIAQKFDGVSDADIRKLNNLKDNKIYPGQNLKIKTEVR